MKMSNGFTVLIPSIITGVGYIASAVFLSIALRQLPLVSTDLFVYFSTSILFIIYTLLPNYNMKILVSTLM
ncbi:hypothetical protein [Butyrivibrio sp. VCD2006]|uniref:hypothetical protein n=1 Tax=Butyrivibrio sp. VCD2006 TaxID=1280664 RepID=UPI003FA43EE7